MDCRSFYGRPLVRTRFIPADSDDSQLDSDRDEEYIPPRNTQSDSDVGLTDDESSDGESDVESSDEDVDERPSVAASRKRKEVSAQKVSAQNVSAQEDEPQPTCSTNREEKDQRNSHAISPKHKEAAEQKNEPQPTCSTKGKKKFQISIILMPSHRSIKRRLRKIMNHSPLVAPRERKSSRSE